MLLICHTGKDGSTCQNTPTSCNHSRASSLAEETSNGYVPMAPVDMDPVERYHSEGKVKALRNACHSWDLAYLCRNCIVLFEGSL